MREINVDDTNTEVKRQVKFMPEYLKDGIKQHFKKAIQAGLKAQGTVGEYLEKKKNKNKKADEASASTPVTVTPSGATPQ